MNYPALRPDAELHSVFIGAFDVTEMVKMAAVGNNSLKALTAKAVELVAASDDVPDDEAETFVEQLMRIYRDFNLWIPNVAAYRLNTWFVEGPCPVCGLDLMSRTETNMYVIDKWTDGPLAGKARWVACIVCDLIMQPLRVVTYPKKRTKAEAKKAMKAGEENPGYEIHGLILQGLEPVGSLIPDVSAAGAIVRLMQPDQVKVLPGMWKAAAGIPEAYTQRLTTMVQYWDEKDDVKKPALPSRLLGPDGNLLN